MFHVVAGDAARDSTEADKGAERVPEGMAAQRPTSGEAQWAGSTATRPATITELWEEYQASQVQSIACWNASKRTLSLPQISALRNA